MVSKLGETRGGKIRSQLIYQWGICHCQSTAIWDCLKKCLTYHSTYGVHCLKCLGLLDFLDSEVVSSGPKPWVPSCQFEAQELFSQTSGISTLDLFWMLEMLGNPDPYMFQASFHNFRAASRVLVGMAEGCWGCNRQARAGCVWAVHFASGSYPWWLQVTLLNLFFLQPKKLNWLPYHLTMAQPYGPRNRFVFADWQRLTMRIWTSQNWYMSWLCHIISWICSSSCYFPLISSIHIHITYHYPVIIPLPSGKLT